MKKGKAIDISQYRYYPKDKEKLELDEIIFEMRDFRVLYIISIPIWALWGIITGAILAVYLTEGATATEWVVGIIIIFILFLIFGSIIPFIRYRAKNKSEKNRIIDNANTYLSDVGEDFLEQVQADLYKGLPFMKKHNLVISERYIIGSIKELGLDPIVIPKEQIQEIAYAIYEQMFYIRGLYWELRQEFFFRLKNGKEIKVHVNDPFNSELALRALQGCGIKMIDISSKSKY